MSLPRQIDFYVKRKALSLRRYAGLSEALVFAMILKHFLVTRMMFTVQISASALRLPDLKNGRAQLLFTLTGKLQDSLKY